MRTFIGTVTMNTTTSKIELTPYCGGELKNIGVVLDVREVRSASDLTYFISNSGRIFWHVDNTSDQANRLWLIPADALIGGGDDTNVSTYATEDPDIVLIDLGMFKSRYIGVKTTDDTIHIIDLCDETSYTYSDVMKYDAWLCSYPEPTAHMPVPIWDNKTGTYSFEDDAWVKPTINAPKPEEV